MMHLMSFPQSIAFVHTAMKGVSYEVVNQQTDHKLERYPSTLQVKNRNLLWINNKRTQNPLRVNYVECND